MGSHGDVGGSQQLQARHHLPHLIRQLDHGVVLVPCQRRRARGSSNRRFNGENQIRRGTAQLSSVLTNLGHRLLQGEEVVPVVPAGPARRGDLPEMGEEPAEEDEEEEEDTQLKNKGREREREEREEKGHLAMSSRGAGPR